MSLGAPKPTRPPGAKVAAKLDPCPICRKPAVPNFVPFCSPRCADIDLGRWLTDRYAIPTAEDEDEDAEAPGGVPAGRARTPD